MLKRVQHDKKEEMLKQVQYGILGPYRNKGI
jgi:hypothetical protein